METQPSILSDRMRGIEKTLIRRIHDLAGPDCIDLGLGELRFPTPRPILDHVRENLGKWKIGYTPNEGYQELRELIAGRSGYPVTPDRICVTVGAQEALMAVLMVIVNAGDEILVPDPGFPAYASLVRMAGGEPATYPLFQESGFKMNAGHVLGALTGKTKAVILNSPNNPSGAVYAGEELEKLAAGLRERSVLAISDEVYKEISFGKRPDSIASYMDRCVVIDSLSKSFGMTGWRIGWCAVPPDMARALAGFHQLAVSCVSSISQRAAIYALKGFADEDKKRNVEELRRRRDLAAKCLDDHTDLSYIKPEGTFYVFVDVADKKPEFGGSLDIAMGLLTKEKVVTIPGVAFGPRGEGHLRLSFAAEPEQIEEGIRRLGRFFA
ncbi:MAG: aminotransferase class I/II-fold pyridoxal phosphate-dependent enzyme [Candidatus Aminicenantales bacterium]